MEIQVSQNQTNALNFRLIAALAAKMAPYCERTTPWPGEVNEAKEQIQKALSEIRDSR
jgi:hypothetical protein